MDAYCRYIRQAYLAPTVAPPSPSPDPLPAITATIDEQLPTDPFSAYLQANYFGAATGSTTTRTEGANPA